MLRALVAIPVLIVLLFCRAEARGHRDPPVVIESVRVGRMAGDSASAEFSVEVSMRARASVAAGWRLGFYMPRPLVQMRGMNPRLVTDLRDDEGHAVPLNYLRAASPTEPDLSAGYTSIFSPASDFALRQGHHYVVAVRHSNQGSVLNESCAPQSFFLVAGAVIAPLPVPRDRYHLLDASSAKGDATRHLQAAWGASSDRSAALDIVPAPLSGRREATGFPLHDRLRIHDRLGGRHVAAGLLAESLAGEGVKFVTVDDDRAATTDIVIRKAAMADPEGYRLEVGPRGVMITAGGEAGAFYAAQTMRQLISGRMVSGATVVDRPRFKYRGLLLDVARHYFPVADIMRLIDVMATHKLNTLHLHFADDEGFRIQIGDGSLNRVSDTRGYGHAIGPMVTVDGELDITNPVHTIYPTAATAYRGTYSRADLARLIAYANRRQITIIPEIEMPGHARAMIKGLPSAFVDPADRSRYASVQGYTDNVIPVCLYGSGTGTGPAFTGAVDRIVREVAAPFASQSTPCAVPNEISVAGDEVSADAWTDDDSCSGTWSGLKSIEKAHRFFSLLGAELPALRFSGWQQLVQDDLGAFDAFSLAATRTGHVWAWLPADTGGLQSARALANGGYPTVLAFADRTYFDLAYTPAIREPGFNWATRFSDTCAALDAAPTAGRLLESVRPEARKNIVGIEGALWSEELPTRAHLMYMALPKMAGLAEACWSPATLTDHHGHVDWRNLAARLGRGRNGFLAYLSRVHGVKYRGFPHGIQLEVP